MWASQDVNLTLRKMFFENAAAALGELFEQLRMASETGLVPDLARRNPSN